MDYEAEDREASCWGNAAVALAGQRATIEEICVAARLPMPINEDDLRYIKVKCGAWGIKCNMEDEAVWQTL